MSDEPSNFRLPAPTLTVRSESVFPVRPMDWKRIRDCVERLPEPERFVQNLAWACIGISIGALLAVLPRAPAYEQLAPDVQLKYAWVAPALLILAAAALVVGVACLLLLRKVRATIVVSKEHVLADMDAIYTVDSQSGNDVDITDA